MTTAAHELEPGTGGIGVAKLLAAAPHRPLFFAGACAVLLSMTWWSLELASLDFGWSRWPQPSVTPGWAHATLMQYGMLPLFMFGFLLTVFPRWLNVAPVSRLRYLLVAGCTFAGYLVAHAGLVGPSWLLPLGLASMLAGYLVAIGTLGGVLRAAKERNQHAWSCLAAFSVGAVGLAAYLVPFAGAPQRLALVSVRVGTFGLLLPVFFTVCHRMLPFFTNNVVSGYRMRRPKWSLPALWALVALRLALDLGGARAWLVLADVPLALLFAWHALAWQPWKARRPGLLLVLHVAFAWLPIAFVLFAAQDVALFGGHVILGRAPLHTLTIGYFGSMLVAMVTRVTQGHSGRPLEMGAVPWLSFALLQLVVLARIYAEVGSAMNGWLLVAAFGWLVAFAPWVLRSAWIYLTPRVDGKPG